jgi:hypothetical protein
MARMDAGMEEALLELLLLVVPGLFGGRRMKTRKKERSLDMGGAREGDGRSVGVRGKPL